MDTSAGSAYGTRTFSTKSAMNETYYSVYSSIWVHCIGSMARAGERGAIRKGCDAFKLGDGFGSE